jgi:hypothetical protein
MQYVNDDMDELFRKAAKDYPLNTGSANWEKVKKALDDPAAGKRPSSRKIDRLQFLWLLLLLPLPWICLHNPGGNGKERVGALSEKPNTALPAENNTSAAPADKNSGKVPYNASEAILNSASTQDVPGFDIMDRKENTLAYTTIRRNTKAVGQEQSQEAAPDIQENEHADLKANETDRSFSEAKASTDPADKKEDTPVPAKDAVQQDTAAVAEPPAKKGQLSRKEKGIYAGFVGGADITSVKMQRVKHVGYDLGVLVGYSINKKWSVEAGLLSSEKAYYSAGEHLYKAYVLPGTELRDAEGDCRMWEVPLVVRYHFNSGKKGAWFASVGSSSYFMQKESYNYTYYRQSTGQEEKHFYSYKSESRHLFAAAQVSGGYHRPIGKSLDLRVEPYVKLPLRKVGHYELPLTSFGVHAGIIKKLF